MHPAAQHCRESTVRTTTSSSILGMQKTTHGPPPRLLLMLSRLARPLSTRLHFKDFGDHWLLGLHTPCLPVLHVPWRLRPGLLKSFPNVPQSLIFRGGNYTATINPVSAGDFPMHVLVDGVGPGVYQRTCASSLTCSYAFEYAALGLSISWHDFQRSLAAARHMQNHI